jgi:sugar/nucleoside kinase (ribokinase family)
MPQVASVGILVADVVAYPVSAYPERGICVHVQRMELHVGGCASNTGLALAKLGIDTVVVGKVGDDPFGDFLIHELNRHGVRTEGIRRTREAGTSSTMVMVHPDGERSFIHYMGANARFSPDDIDWSLLRGCKVFHLAGAFLMPAMDGEPAAQVLQQARAMGMLTCLDTTWDATGGWMHTLAPCLPHLDYIVPNYGEASQLTGETEPERIADRLLDAGVGTAVIKMGDRGCFVKNRQQAFHLPAYQVEVVGRLRGRRLLQRRFCGGACARLGTGAGSPISQCGGRTLRHPAGRHQWRALPARDPRLHAPCRESYACSSQWINSSAKS